MARGGKDSHHEDLLKDPAPLFSLRARRHSYRLLRSVLLLAAFVAAIAGPATAADAAKPRSVARRLNLGQRIKAILQRTEARRGLWGIEVVRLSDGKVLLTRNAERLFLPASTMKLFTTAAAIERLGPDFVFRTTVEAEAAPNSNGRVGDLFLVGRGDPSLGNRVLPGQFRSGPQEPADAVVQRLADQVVSRGVREVAGNLVADDSYFLFEPYSHGWDAEDTQWGYGAPVTALAFNDNALLLRIRPGAAPGATAEVHLEPFPDYYGLNNRVETSAAGTQRHIFVERAPGSRQLDVWGQIPQDDIEAQDSVSIDNPPQFIGELLRHAMEARGIAIRGRVEVRYLTRIQAASTPDPFSGPSPRVVLAEHVSGPLSQEIKTINKFSHNLHVEMLLRTLGREVKNDGSLNAGLDVLNEFAAQVGIDPAEASFADGSGLSRHALVAPRAVIKLLKYMAASPRFEVYLDSLPVAGVDGTLAERFTGSPGCGRVRAKTGTMEHVNALAGYMELPSGRRLAFCIMGNGYLLKPAAGATVVDRIALAILRQFSGRQKAR
jgi:D-alanyl-D-alanine carboxypeptidase/D-alanyl-D-alanine-endopeptidase (penicillin-binding protein 4)